jgi:hypothetical protein
MQTSSIKYIMADVTESPINRQKKQKERRSGKEKSRAIETRAIIEQKTAKIIDIRKDKGSERDFKMNLVHQSIWIEADLGSVGIEIPHSNSRAPKKASKKRALNERKKKFGKRLAQDRAVIEHLNARIKTFKSMSYPYRNHCRRHLLRMSLICGVINFELRI